MSQEDNLVSYYDELEHRHRVAPMSEYRAYQQRLMASQGMASRQPQRRSQSSPSNLGGLLAGGLQSGIGRVAERPEEIRQQSANAPSAGEYGKGILTEWTPLKYYFQSLSEQNPGGGGIVSQAAGMLSLFNPVSTFRAASDSASRMAVDAGLIAASPLARSQQAQAATGALKNWGEEQQEAGFGRLTPEQQDAVRNGEWWNPTKVAWSALESTPDMAGMLGMAALAPSTAPRSLKNKLGELTEGIPSWALGGAKTAEARGAAAIMAGAGAGSEGSISAIDAASVAREEALAAGLTPEQANEAAMEAARRTFAPVAAVGLLGSPVEVGLLNKIGGAWGPRTLRKQAADVVGGALTEAGEEFLQSGSESLISDEIARKYYDPDRQVGQNYFTDALHGALTGGVMGGGMSIAGAAAENAHLLKEAFDTTNVEDISQLPEGHKARRDHDALIEEMGRERDAYFGPAQEVARATLAQEQAMGLPPTPAPPPNIPIYETVKGDQAPKMVGAPISSPSPIAGETLVNSFNPQVVRQKPEEAAKAVANQPTPISKNEFSIQKLEGPDLDGAIKELPKESVGNTVPERIENLKNEIAGLQSDIDRIAPLDEYAPASMVERQEMNRATMMGELEQKKKELEKLEASKPPFIVRDKSGKPLYAAPTQSAAKKWISERTKQPETLAQLSSSQEQPPQAEAAPQAIPPQESPAFAEPVTRRADALKEKVKRTKDIASKYGAEVDLESIDYLKEISQLKPGEAIPFAQVRVQEGSPRDGIPPIVRIEASARAFALANPDLSDAELYKKFMRTINHEMVHALKRSGAITTPQWAALVAESKKRKWVDPTTGKKSAFTYYQHAFALYSSIPEYQKVGGKPNLELIQEEGVAEMFRHWAERYADTNRPGTGVFRKIYNLLKDLLALNKHFKDLTVEELEKRTPPTINGKPYTVWYSEMLSDVGMSDLEREAASFYASAKMRGFTDEEILGTFEKWKENETKRGLISEEAVEEQLAAIKEQMSKLEIKGFENVSASAPGTMRIFQLTPHRFEIMAGKAIEASGLTEARPKQWLDELNKQSVTGSELHFTGLRDFLTSKHAENPSGKIGKDVLLEWLDKYKIELIVETATAVYKRPDSSPEFLEQARYFPSGFGVPSPIVENAGNIPPVSFRDFKWENADHANGLAKQLHSLLGSGVSPILLAKNPHIGSRGSVYSLPWSASMLGSKFSRNRRAGVIFDDASIGKIQEEIINRFNQRGLSQSKVNRSNALSSKEALSSYVNILKSAISGVSNRWSDITYDELFKYAPLTYKEAENYSFDNPGFRAHLRDTAFNNRVVVNVFAGHYPDDDAGDDLTFSAGVFAHDLLNNEDIKNATDDYVKALDSLSWLVFEKPSKEIVGQRRSQNHTGPIYGRSTGHSMYGVPVSFLDSPDLYFARDQFSHATDLSHESGQFKLAIDGVAQVISIASLVDDARKKTGNAELSVIAESPKKNKFISNGKYLDNHRNPFDDYKESVSETIGALFGGEMEKTIVERTVAAGYQASALLSLSKALKRRFDKGPTEKESFFNKVESALDLIAELRLITNYDLRDLNNIGGINKGSMEGKLLLDALSRYGWGKKILEKIKDNSIVTILPPHAHTFGRSATGFEGVILYELAFQIAKAYYIHPTSQSDRDIDDKAYMEDFGGWIEAYKKRETERGKRIRKEVFDFADRNRTQYDNTLFNNEFTDFAPATFDSAVSQIMNVLKVFATPSVLYGDVNPEEEITVQRKVIDKQGEDIAPLGAFLMKLGLVKPSEVKDRYDRDVLYFAPDGWRTTEYNSDGEKDVIALPQQVDKAKRNILNLLSLAADVNENYEDALKEIANTASDIIFLRRELYNSDKLDNEEFVLHYARGVKSSSAVADIMRRRHVWQIRQDAIRKVSEYLEEDLGENNPSLIDLLGYFDLSDDSSLDHQLKSIARETTYNAIENLLFPMKDVYNNIPVSRMIFHEVGDVWGFPRDRETRNEEEKSTQAITYRAFQSGSREQTGADLVSRAIHVSSISSEDQRVDPRPVSSNWNMAINLIAGLPIERIYQTINFNGMLLEKAAKEASVNNFNPQNYGSVSPIIKALADGAEGLHSSNFAAHGEKAEFIKKFVTDFILGLLEAASVSHDDNIENFVLNERNIKNFIEANGEAYDSQLMTHSMLRDYRRHITNMASALADHTNVIAGNGNHHPRRNANSVSYPGETAYGKSGDVKLFSNAYAEIPIGINRIPISYKMAVRIVDPVRYNQILRSHPDITPETAASQAFDELSHNYSQVSSEEGWKWAGNHWSDREQNHFNLGHFRFNLLDAVDKSENPSGETALVISIAEFQSDLGQRLDPYIKKEGDLEKMSVAMDALVDLERTSLIFSVMSTSDSSVGTIDRTIGRTKALGYRWAALSAAQLTAKANAGKPEVISNNTTLASNMTDDARKFFSEIPYSISSVAKAFVDLNNATLSIPIYDPGNSGEGTSPFLLKAPISQGPKNNTELYERAISEFTKGDAVDINRARSAFSFVLKEILEPLTPVHQKSVDPHDFRVLAFKSVPTIEGIASALFSAVSRKADYKIKARPTNDKRALIVDLLKAYRESVEVDEWRLTASGFIKLARDNNLKNIDTDEEAFLEGYKFYINETFTNEKLNSFINGIDKDDIPAFDSTPPRHTTITFDEDYRKKDDALTFITALGAINRLEQEGDVKDVYQTLIDPISSELSTKDVDELYSVSEVYLKYPLASFFAAKIHGDILTDWDHTNYSRVFDINVGGYKKIVISPDLGERRSSDSSSADNDFYSKRFYEWNKTNRRATEHGLKLLRDILLFQDTLERAIDSTSEIASAVNSIMDRAMADLNPSQNSTDKMTAGPMIAAIRGLTSPHGIDFDANKLELQINPNGYSSPEQIGGLFASGGPLNIADIFGGENSASSSGRNSVLLFENASMVSFGEEFLRLLGQDVSLVSDKDKTGYGNAYEKKVRALWKALAKSELSPLSGTDYMSLGMRGILLTAAEQNVKYIVIEPPEVQFVRSSNPTTRDGFTFSPVVKFENGRPTVSRNLFFANAEINRGYSPVSNIEIRKEFSADGEVYNASEDNFRRLYGMEKHGVLPGESLHMHGASPGKVFVGINNTPGAGATRTGRYINIGARNKFKPAVQNLVRVKDFEKTLNKSKLSYDPNDPDTPIDIRGYLGAVNNLFERMLQLTWEELGETNRTKFLAFVEEARELALVINAKGFENNQLGVMEIFSKNLLNSDGQPYAEHDYTDHGEIYFQTIEGQYQRIRLAFGQKYADASGLNFSKAYEELSEKDKSLIAQFSDLTNKSNLAEAYSYSSPPPAKKNDIDPVDLLNVTLKRLGYKHHFLVGKTGNLVAYGTGGTLEQVLAKEAKKLVKEINTEEISGLELKNAPTIAVSHRASIRADGRQSVTGEVMPGRGIKVSEELRRKILEDAKAGNLRIFHLAGAAFGSTVENAIESSKPEQLPATRQGWISWVEKKGASKQEIYWTGIGEWLKTVRIGDEPQKGTDRITVNDIKGYLLGTKVKVVETSRGDQLTNPPIRSDLIHHYRQLSNAENYLSSNYAVRDASGRISRPSTTPLKAYTEVIYTMGSAPAVYSDDEMLRIPSDPPYPGGHWANKGNVNQASGLPVVFEKSLDQLTIGHARVTMWNIRGGPADGLKALNIEEVQAEISNVGNKKGVLTPQEARAKVRLDTIGIEISAAEDAIARANTDQEEMEAEKRLRILKGERFRLRGIVNRAADRMKRDNPKAADTIKSGISAVARLPFADDAFYDFVLKDLLIKAVQNNIDYITWDDPETHRKRLSLGSHLGAGAGKISMTKLAQKDEFDRHEYKVSFLGNADYDRKVREHNRTKERLVGSTRSSMDEGMFREYFGAPIAKWALEQARNLPEGESFEFDLNSPEVEEIDRNSYNFLYAKEAKLEKALKRLIKKVDPSVTDAVDVVIVDTPHVSHAKIPADFSPYYDSGYVAEQDTSKPMSRRGFFLSPAFKSFFQKKDALGNMVANNTGLVEIDADAVRKTYTLLQLAPTTSNRPVLGVATKQQQEFANKIMRRRYMAGYDWLVKGISFLPNVTQAQAENMVDHAGRYISDRFIAVRRLQKKIQDSGGKINDASDPVLRETLYPGKTMSRLKTMRANVFKPAYKKVVEIGATKKDLEALAKVSDFAAAELELTGRQPSHAVLSVYLYAMHAKERNEFIRDIRKAREFDPATGQYSEEALKYGSGMPDDEADRILAWFSKYARMQHVEEAAKAIWGIIAHTRQVRINAGLTIDYEAMKGNPEFPMIPNFKYYVPLRGFIKDGEGFANRAPPGNYEEDEPINLHSFTGKMFKIFGREDRGMKGRQTYAGDIIEHVIMQASEAVVRAEKNLVGLSFLYMIEDNKELVKNHANVIYKLPLRPSIERATGKIRFTPDHGAKQDDNTFIVKQDGKEVLIRISTDLAFALNRVAGFGDSVGDLLARVAFRFTRFYSQLQTSMNPQFMVPNLMRDVQTAVVQGMEFDRASALKIPNEWRRVITGLLSGDQKIYEEVKLLERMGGTTATYGLRSLEDQRAEIKAELEDLLQESGQGDVGRASLKALMKALELIETFNDYAETATRLAVFNSFKAKVGNEMAAQLAKDLTTNFNRKGAWAPWFNALWSFWNAATQGSGMMVKALTSKGGQTAAMALIMLGVLEAMFMPLMGGGGDDDDDTAYDRLIKAEPWTASRNLLIVGPNDHIIKIPLPHGFNIFVDAGRSITRVMQGKDDPGKAAIRTVSGIADMFDPFGSPQESFVQKASPTIIRPFADLVVNEDFAGRPIHQTPLPFGVQPPPSQTGTEYDSEFALFFTNALSRITGGDGLMRPGAIEIYPGSVDHLFASYTGGLGRTVAQTVNLIGWSITPQEKKDLSGRTLELRDVPVVRAFITKVGSYTDRQAYQEAVDRFVPESKSLEMAYKQGDYALANRIETTRAQQVQIGEYLEGVERRRLRIRRSINSIKDSQMSDTEKAAMLKSLREEENELMSSAIKEVSALERATR